MMLIVRYLHKTLLVELFFRQKFCGFRECFYICSPKRGISSVGRAFEWHSKGQEFDSPMLHKNPSQSSLRGIFRIECDKKCNNLRTKSKSLCFEWYDSVKNKYSRYWSPRPYGRDERNTKILTRSAPRRVWNMPAPAPHPPRSGSLAFNSLYINTLVCF